MPSTLVEDVDRVCHDRIAPAALAVDSEVVPRSHVDALAATGLLGRAVDEGAEPAEVRRAHERLAGACLSTWFVVAQHQTPVQLVRSAPLALRSAVLPLLTSGTSLAGIAFSHLRHWPHRPVEVERFGKGWRFTGTAPWYTGWGINDVAVLAGVSPDDAAVFALVPAEASPQLRPGQPSDTVAMTASRTVPLVLDGLVVPDEGVLAVVPMQSWGRDDRAKTANVSPAVLGVTQAAVQRLAAGRDEAGRQAARVFEGALADIRDRAYALLDAAEPSTHLQERLGLRARALTLCLDAAGALVASRGGRAMLRDDDAQLLARWALFLTVQAQTTAVRDATLGALSRRWVAG